MKTLSVEPDTHASLLVPLINEKLPDDLKILHQFDSDVWSLSKMLEYLKKETEARERTAALTCSCWHMLPILKFVIKTMEEDTAFNLCQKRET